MNRLDRLNAILIHLQSKKVVTAREIARRFETSIRTVYRDIRSLEEAGIPIGAEAGTGYFLADNFTLPPVMFTTDEASALLIGAKLTSKMADTTISKNMESALFKIKAVLKNHDKELVDKLEESITVFHRSTFATPNLYLSEIQQAILNCRTVIIEYKTFTTEKQSTREVLPAGLCFYGGNWHLIAFCKLRSDYRDFRVDRIQNLTITQNSYSPSGLIKISEFFNIAQNDKNLVKIRLRFHRDYSDNIIESKYWYGFIGEEIAEDKIEMTFVNTDLFGFAKWLLWAGDKVEIIEPQELKTVMTDFVGRLYKKYCGKSKGEVT